MLKGVCMHFSASASWRSARLLLVLQACPSGLVESFIIADQSGDVTFALADEQIIALWSELRGVTSPVHSSLYT